VHADEGGPAAAPRRGSRSPPKQQSEWAVLAALEAKKLADDTAKAKARFR
jgi:hypothetical protein